jgi:hypothetical protein
VKLQRQNPRLICPQHMDDRAICSVPSPSVYEVHMATQFWLYIRMKWWDGSLPDE